MKHSHHIFSDSIRAIRFGLAIGLALANLSAAALECDGPRHMRDNINGEEVFRYVEQMPQFPGGDAALMKYLQEEIKYPPEAVKDSIQGRVFLQFVVDKAGYVGEIKVVHSVREDLDLEAVRVIKTLPRFLPGRQNGKAVSVWYALPVTFKLQDKNASNESQEVQEPKKEVKVKQNAVFPGGEDALVQYIKDNTKYPPKAVKKRIQGTVTVEYLVDKTGKVSNARVSKSANKELDREALRVIKSLPDFTPARVDGEPVEVWIHQQVNFRIPDIKYHWMKSAKIESK